MMKTIVAILFSVCFTSAAYAKNLHLVEENPQTGFAIYRTGLPNLSDFKRLCKIGVTKMIVLSGDGSIEEKYAKQYCPQLEVIYNKRQSSRVALSREFLNQFDSWITDAQARGEKIAFRCKCGCHRTGRLAAYYQMKYQNLSAKDSIAIMYKHGKWMLFFPHLKPQVYALADYIRGRPCSQAAKHCVRDTEPTERELRELEGDYPDNS